ncbi:MAG: hypothetical protein J5697_02910 [Clostridia bacterium]|nr:hypothetical protein [Clostridia bacterium]
MENKKKAETFIGFTVRTGRYKTGLNAVSTLKRARLVILCKSASDNTKEEGRKFALKFRCPVLITEEKTLGELIFKDGVKIMAITDGDIAKAIIDNKETVLKDLSGV